MRTRRSIVGLALLGLLLTTPAMARSAPVDKVEQGLQLHKNLSRDPVIVLGLRLDDRAGGLRGLAGLVERFTLETVEGEMPPASRVGRFDPEVAAMVRTELLSRVGPEMVIVVDLPPIDEAVARLQFSREDALATLLDRTGLVARVKDGPGLDRAVRDWVLVSGGEIADSDGMAEAAVPIRLAPQDDESVPASHVRLFWAFDGGRIALGFSPEWVQGALATRAKGRRLVDGDDYKRVFARLDARPSDLVYVNLPKIRELVTGSRVIQMVLQANQEFREFYNRVFTSETMSVGIGATSVRLPDGVRTTNFGPPWMAGTAVSGGYIAALALPNLLTAVDRGRTRRTVTDIEAIAQACEGFSTDSRVYPGPTNGWVPVEQIATYLEPVYIGSLPLTDGWQNPILYWSDGGSYRILSRGRDGLIDRDWTGPVDEQGSAAEESDIVFGDGRLLAWPSALGE